MKHMIFIASFMKPSPRWWLFSLVLVFFLGCSDPPEEASPPDPEGEVSPDLVVLEEEDASSPEPKKDQRALVEEVAEQLPTVFAERAAQGNLDKALDARLQAAIRHAKRRRVLPKKERPNRDLYYEQTLEQAYRDREWAPIFVLEGKLSPAGLVLLETLKEAGVHGLVPEDYWLARIETSRTKQEGLQVAVGGAGLSLSEREQEVLLAWLELHPLEGGAEAVFELLFSSSPENPLPRIPGALSLSTEGRADLMLSSVELEVLFADAFLRYVRDMRAANLNRLSEEERAKYGEEVHPKYHSEIVLNRMRKELETFAKLDEGGARDFLNELPPSHDQYAKLQEIYQKYKAIADGGGWGRIEPGKMYRGGRAPKVIALKKRLAAEGYYDGLMDDLYDDNLADAIALYQETHQMEITGDPSPVFWRSLNLSAEHRAEEILVNLHRWRRTRFVKSDYYIYINVPDFHAEVWKEKERKMRFKLVVGNTKKVCHSSGKWRYANATPLQHAKISHLVFNPYWNVPPRIHREEYAPEIEADAKWLDKNNFEFHRTRDGQTILRQKPGVTNALGQVKFIFPNKHNTYMHDTPKKEFFEYSVRAFSHGCMRAEDPMNLAEFILEQEGKWDDKEVLSHLKKSGETPIYLDQSIDVFIEYFTVRVDDFGRAHFLADIYKYVKYEVNPPPPGALRCDPAAQGGGDASVPAGADFGP